MLPPQTYHRTLCVVSKQNWHYPCPLFSCHPSSMKQAPEVGEVSKPLKAGYF